VGHGSEGTLVLGEETGKDQNTNGRWTNHFWGGRLNGNDEGCGRIGNLPLVQKWESRNLTSRPGIGGWGVIEKSVKSWVSSKSRKRTGFLLIWREM